MVLSPAERRPRRADARRNYDRLLDAAREAVATHGADASLDDIARRAGVGSGTLYRHFPSRSALLEAVFHDQVAALLEQANALTGTEDPGAALDRWLQAVLQHSIRYRGLAASLKAAESGWCHATMRTAADELVERAKATGTVRPEVTGSDLLKIINGLALANLECADADASSARMLGYVLAGLRPPGRPQLSS
ncbi:TetR/AcrR family transcriptional regulator [Cryptosporangium phraense]|uniref:TetR/AcrR family transcriptional regulator n=1 Tax=Cryptosporangium phraense TaxID=2593070 RepID=UPI00197A85D5|nr:TetR/AcrR family transcriptional regulator [Cryptosporangium phraense]